MTTNNRAIETRFFNIKKVDETTITSILDDTASCLASDGVIALPTDTIYGIACSVISKDGIDKLYDIKKRNISKPISICVAEIEDMEKWANVTLSHEILERLFPGQITALFTRKEELSPSLNPTITLIGIRIPDNQFIRKLVKKCQCPIALTSANRSGYESSLQVEEFQEIWNQINIVIDGGRINSQENPECRKGSTVIDFSFLGHYDVIREGSSYDNIIKTLLECGIKKK